METKEKEASGEEKDGRSIKRLIFGERADRYATFGMLAAALTYFGNELWKKISGRVVEKGLKMAERKAEKILGLDTEEAKKDLSDEFLYRVALHGLSPDVKNAERKDLAKFKADLKAANPEWAEAFTLFIAQMLNKHAKDSKKTSRLGKGKNPPRVEEVSKLYDFTYTNEFLKELLSKSSFKDKLEFLKDENVFSLIKSKPNATGIDIDTIEKILQKAGKAASSIGDSLRRNLPKAEEKLGKYLKTAGKGVKKSAKAVNKEADELATWIDKNIHKKVKYKGFSSEWNWFLQPLIKRVRKWRNHRNQNRDGRPSASLLRIIWDSTFGRPRERYY